MKKITENTEFIIGIDFGHGETSAAFYDLKKKDNDNVLTDLDILPGLDHIASAVAILEQEGKETICIGENAVNFSGTAKDFKINIKKRPSTMNETERNRMVKFMKGVYAAILERYPDYNTREHVVYIARPSQDKLWKTEEEQYLKIAEDAGLPVAGIQKESRAAYFRARTQPDSKIDMQVKNGVLIVDFGSSTIDFTYLNSQMVKPIDDGCSLGASEVEKLLMQYAMEHPTDPIMPEFAKLYGHDPSSNAYNKMLFRFRKAKEDFYKNRNPFFSVGLDYGFFTSSEETQINGWGGFSVPKDKVNEILGQDREDGYIWKVREAVKAFKQDELKDKKVACVYLTGGASRMDFVHQIFMETFHLDEVHCPFDNHPELIVSQGVAQLSYADIKTEATGKEMQDLAHEKIKNFDWKVKMRKIICKCMKESIISKADLIMFNYARPNSPITTVKGLNDEIENTFKNMTNFNFVPECEKEIKKEIVDEVKKELREALFAYNYDNEDVELNLSALDARITSDGAGMLSFKFTGDNRGHIIQDAIRDEYGIFTFDVNQLKEREYEVRKRHYDFYKREYRNIYLDRDWEWFLGEDHKYVKIEGIDKLVTQISEDIDNMIKSYVDHAKLAVFFN